MHKHIRQISLPRLLIALGMFTIVCSASIANAADDGVNTDAGANNIERDCFWQLTKGNSDKIKCDFPVRMTAEELKKVQDITRGVLQNAHCNMTVDIDRKLVNDAMYNSDHIFETPEQPVICQIITSKKDFSLNMHFKPRVVFKDGKAIKATPGMGATTRTTRAISWPVRKWVNTSNEIEDAMIRIINAYLKQYRK